MIYDFSTVSYSCLLYTSNIKSVYFVGAGGIGMSALIRYFLSTGKLVAGYDRTPSELDVYKRQE